MEILLLWIAMLSVYMFPAIIAHSRKHNNFASICCTNLLLGWTGFAWIIALIWAFSSNRVTS